MRIKTIGNGLPYCEDCPNANENKNACASYWRPQTGTKHGFPVIQEDGSLWNCPKDSFVKNGNEKE